MSERAKRAAKVVDEDLSVRIIDDFRIEARIETTNLTGLDAVKGLLGRVRTTEDRGSAYRWRCRDAEDILRLCWAVHPYVEQRRGLVEAVIDYLLCSEPLELYYKADTLRRFS